MEILNDAGLSKEEFIELLNQVYPLLSARTSAPGGSLPLIISSSRRASCSRAEILNQVISTSSKKSTLSKSLSKVAISGISLEMQVEAIRASLSNKLYFSKIFFIIK